MTPNMVPDRSRLLVIGANGFLGSNLALSAAGDCEVILHTRRPLARRASGEHHCIPLASIDQIQRLMDEARPQIVINCAAVADIEVCERDQDLAFEVNAILPQRLARTCRDRGIAFVHVSTDAVFGGLPGPYNEASPVSPINQYGKSKAEGDRGVLAEAPNALVVRTNIVGWSPSGSRSLLEFFFNELRGQGSPPGFQDVFFRPLSALSVWPLIREWLSAPSKRGLRHATGGQLLSKYEFGRLVAKTFGFDPNRIIPTSITSQAGRVTRSSMLDVRPSASTGISPPSPMIEDALLELREVASGGWRHRLEEFRTA